MTAVPLLPRNAPFAPEDIETLNSVVARTTPLQRSWLAGFFAGFEAAQGGAQQQPQPAAAAKPREPLTVLYATESGNAEALAMRTKKLAQKHGLDARIFDMADADLSVLAKAKNLMRVRLDLGRGRSAGPRRRLLYGADGRRRTAHRGRALCRAGAGRHGLRAVLRDRQGDRRAPGGARRRARRRPRRPRSRLRQAGCRVDGRGAGQARAADAAATATVVHVDFKGAGQLFDDEEPHFTAENPLAAEIAALVNLNGTGSTRETWHVELATDAPGFTYKPGDSIGILPENDPDLALELAEAVGLGADGSVVRKLRESYDVTTLSRSLVEAYAKLTGRTDVAKLTDGEGVHRLRRRPPAHRSVRDLPGEAHRRAALGLLRPLPRAPLLGRLEPRRAPRRGASPRRRRALGLARQEAQGRCFHLSRRPAAHGRHGSHLRQAEPPFPPAGRRRPPDHHDRRRHRRRALSRLRRGARRARVPRARAGWSSASATSPTTSSTSSNGRSTWRRGAVSRIDVAFSRDQPEKIYVQHRLWEQRAELLSWVDDGAHLYVCGDEKGMARDVDVMLARILAEARAATTRRPCQAQGARQGRPLSARRLLNERQGQLKGLRP